MDNMQTLIKNYLEYCDKQKCLNEKTLKAYKIDLNQFLSHICSSDITDISTSMLEDYIGELHKKIQTQDREKKNRICQSVFPLSRIQRITGYKSI